MLERWRNSPEKKRPACGLGCRVWLSRTSRLAGSAINGDDTCRHEGRVRGPTELHAARNRRRSALPKGHRGVHGLDSNDVPPTSGTVRNTAGRVVANPTSRPRCGRGAIVYCPRAATESARGDSSTPCGNASAEGHSNSRTVGPVPSPDHGTDRRTRGPPGPTSDNGGSDPQPQASTRSWQPARA